MQLPSKPIIIGKIIETYGIKGWLKIISFTEKYDSIFDYTPWFVWFKSRWELLQLENWLCIKKKYIVKFITINNRELAMSFNTLDIYVDSSKFPILLHGEYYWKDIIGCQVITITENRLGYVISIIETVIYDILVVNINKKNIQNIESHYIPFILHKFIKNVNLITNTIVVDWIS